MHAMKIDSKGRHSVITMTMAKSTGAASPTRHHLRPTRRELNAAFTKEQEIFTIRLAIIA